MNRYKATILEHFVSTKALAGPAVSPASAGARSALRDDRVYAELKRRLDAIGFFAPAPGDYAWRIAATLAIAAAGWAALVLARSIWLHAAGALAVGVAMVQSSFLAHDAGHGALARRPWLVALLGQLHSTLIAGYAFSYFRRSHDLHHFHTNEDGVDPDCLSELVSVDPCSARRKTGLGRLITRHQAVIIPLLLPLWALTMKWDGLTYVACNHRRCRSDIAALVLHAWVWLAVPAVVVGPELALGGYLAANMVAGLYLGAVIPVNHVGTSYLSSGHALSFLEQQLATCRNVRSPGPPPVAAVFDFLFIGLNRQIEHHLFPWAPVCRLARGAAVTRAFCRERGLPYHETTYRQAVYASMQHLACVARSVDRQSRMGTFDADSARVSSR
jgi:fatty acid desaturase